MSISALFSVEPLSAAEAASAYPLIRLSLPGCSLPQWRRLTRHFGRARRDRGLMAIRDRRGLMHGLFSYCVERTVRRGDTLRILDVVVAQLPGPSIGEIVLESGEMLRRDLRCESLVIDMPVVHGAALQGSALYDASGTCPDRLKPDVISFRVEPD